VLSLLYPSFPRILCFPEHHLNQQEIELTQIDSYALGASFCRTSLKMSGLCIFVNKNLNFKNDIQKFLHERDIEAGAVKLTVNSLNICILSIYRAPSGNFALFLDKLETILNLLYKNNTQLIICGDMNINYLDENNKKTLLNSLLASYNLTSTVYFPTRIQNTSATAIDNIFINVSKFDDYIIFPIVNGLSDHDAQLIAINNKFKNFE
jgi:exonuclease III